MTCLETRKAQSMVELSFVVLAVIAGIILGGPYLLDSVNSHFKLWDTAVSDSNNDRLVQANKDDLNIPHQECTLVSKAPSTCGSERCKDAGHDETARDITWQYQPVGCQTKFTCESDNECCTEPIEKDLCWRKYDPSNSTRLWAEAQQVPAKLLAQGFRACGPGGANCQNGDQLYTFSCGDLKNMFIGFPNPDKCMPKCHWETVPNNATRCPDPQGDGRYMDTDKVNPDLLLYNQPCSSSPGDCQAKCNDGFKPNNGSCAEIACELITTFSTGASAGSYYQSARYDENVRFISDVCADDFNYSYRVDGGPWQGNCAGPVWSCNYSDKNKHDGGGTAQCARITATGHQIEIYLWDGGDGHDATQISGYIYREGSCSLTVNGGWGAWGPCASANPYYCMGIQYRSCNNPAPAYGGENCPNFANAYFQYCNAPVGSPGCFCRDNPSDPSCQSQGSGDNTR
jgi:hypothetical protein